MAIFNPTVCSGRLWLCSALLVLSGAALAAHDPPGVETTNAVIMEGAGAQAGPGLPEETPCWPSRLPKDLGGYQPMPFPQEQDPAGFDSLHPENQWVSYDTITGEETYSDVQAFADLLDQMRQVPAAAVPGSKGSGDVPPELAMPETFNALSPVGSYSDWPWRANCKVFMNIDGTNYVCSGTMIDALHVLTAGHCVHGGSGSNWATNVAVVPAYSNGAEPFGDAGGIQLHSWTGWTSDSNFDHDMGIIDLDRPIGALTGWFGYGYNTDCNFFTTPTHHNASYPAEPAGGFNGCCMYYRYGNLDSCLSDYRLQVDTAGWGGMSGSSVYYIDNDNRAAYSVTSTSDRATYTRFCRITSSKYTSIGTFISDDTPAGFDLIPLDANSSPSSVAAGSPLTLLNFLVHNYSSVTYNGSVNFDIRLSTNDIISTGDRLISSQSLNWNFAPKGSVRVNCALPTIPADVSPGTYYLGMILTTADNNAGNNGTGSQDVSSITVTCPAQSPPSGVAASDGTFGSFVRVTWSPQAGAGSYEIWRHTSASSASATQIAPSVAGTSYDDATALLGTTYYYWVKARNACGSVSGFSGYDTGFRTSPPAITGALSLRTHSGAGSYGINVHAAGAVEDRSAGPNRIRVFFERAIQGVGGLDNTDVSLSSGNVASLSIAGSTLDVFCSGAANAANLTVSFPGIADASSPTATVTQTLCFGVLGGDANGDRSVNIFDLIAIRNVLNQTVGSANFRNDVNADGAINIFDLIATRNLLNQTIATACP